MFKNLRDKLDSQRDVVSVKDASREKPYASESKVEKGDMMSPSSSQNLLELPDSRKEDFEEMEAQRYDEMSRQELLTTLRKTQNNCKRYSTKFSDLLVAYKDTLKMKDKLESALEVQQDSASLRIRELNEVHKCDVEAKTKLAEALRQRCAEREEENTRLKSKLEETEGQLYTTMRAQERTTSECDAANRLVQSLNKQMSTLKQELERTNTIVQEKDSMLRDRLATIESRDRSIQELQQGRESLQQQGRQQVVDLSVLTQHLDSARVLLKEKEAMLVEMQTKLDQQAALAASVAQDRCRPSAAVRGALPGAEEPDDGEAAEAASSLRALVHDKDTAIQGLRDRVRSLEEQLLRAEDTNIASRAELQARLADASQLRTELQRANRMTAEAQARAERETAEALAAARQQVAASSAAAEQLRADAATLRAQHQEAVALNDAAVARLTATLETRTAEVQKLSVAYDTKTAALLEAAQRLEELVANNRRLELAVEGSQAAAEKLKQARDTSRREAAEAQARAEGAELANSALAADVASLGERLMAKAEECAAALRQLEEAAVFHADARAALQSQVADLSTRLAAETAACQDLRGRLVPLEAQSIETAQQLQQLQAEHGQLRTEADHANAQLGLLVASEAEARASLALLEETASNSQATLATQGLQLQSLQDESAAAVEQARTERAGLEEQLAAAQRELQRATRLQLQYAGELRKALQPRPQENEPGLVRVDGREINFEYLKNVILKYMTSRNAESRHLLKVIATLLQFTAHEEALVRHFLASKSWFPSPSP